MKVCRKERDRREEERTEKDTKGPENLCDLRNMMNSSQMMEFCKYFTYIHLLGAEAHDRMVWSVFIISHQFMNCVGNILRTEFWVSCWVFWSRALTHRASRGRKQLGDISVSQIWQSCFPEDIRCADWEGKMWVRGHNDFSFHLKQTNSIYLAHIYWHICWKITMYLTAEKNIFCFRDYFHFWWYASFALQATAESNLDVII